MQERGAQAFAAVAGTLVLSAGASAQSPYKVTDLEVMPGYASWTATQLNDRGEVVGHCAPAVENFNQTAVVWCNGTVSSLGPLTGGQYSMATAINSSGKIAGDGDTGNIRPQSCVTTANGLLNIFPNNDGTTHASYIALVGSSIMASR